MGELEAYIGGHPVLLAVLGIGGLALILIPLVTYLAARRSANGGSQNGHSRKDPPSDA